MAKRAGLNQMSYIELKRYAQDLGMENYQNLDKGDLVDVMLKIGVKDEAVYGFNFVSRTFSGVKPAVDMSIGGRKFCPSCSDFVSHVDQCSYCDYKACPTCVYKLPGKNCIRCQNPFKSRLLTPLDFQINSSLFDLEIFTDIMPEEVQKFMSETEECETEIGEDPEIPSEISPEILVVFDMDCTLIGNTGSMTDRDTIETTFKWKGWPSHIEPGVSQDEIIAELHAGLLRPGTIELLLKLLELNIVIVVYTAAEDEWAKRMIQAIESYIGQVVFYRIFARKDSLDQEWDTHKRLSHIIDILKTEDNFDWLSLDRTILIDDRSGVVPSKERDRQVLVPPYSWRSTIPLFVHLTEEILSRNPSFQRSVNQSLINWGYDYNYYTKQWFNPENFEAMKQNKTIWDSIFWILLQNLEQPEDVLKWPTLKLA